MHGSPVLWGENSQLSGDFIYLTIQNGNPHRMYIDTNAFVMSRDTLTFFNQVSGRNMVAYFKNNALYKADVFGNSQTVYYVRDDKKELVGVNLSTSSDLRLTLDNNGIKDIIYLSRPEASLNPLKSLSKRDRYLKGYNDQEAIRPKDKYDIFRWN